MQPTSHERALYINMHATCVNRGVVFAARSKKNFQNAIILVILIKLISTIPEPLAIALCWLFFKIEKKK